MPPEEGFDLPGNTMCVEKLLLTEPGDDFLPPCIVEETDKGKDCQEQAWMQNIFSYLDQYLLTVV